MDKPVSVGAFKARVIAYLGQVREGETLLLTERNHPLARLIPVFANPREQALYDLARSGQVLWDGGKPFGLSDREAPSANRHRVGVLVETESSR